MPAGGRLRVRSGKQQRSGKRQAAAAAAADDDGVSEIHWGKQYKWNNAGDTAVLRDANGAVVSRVRVR